MKINTSRLAARIRAMALLATAALSGYWTVTAGSAVGFFVLSTFTVMLVFLAIVDLAVDTRFEKDWQ